MRTWMIRLLCLAVATALAAMALPVVPARADAGEGRVIVEMQGESFATSLASRTIEGTDNVTKQDYKFKQERHGTDFHYLLSGLAQANYKVEFSFVETKYTSAGKRVFSVYANGSPIALPNLSNVDVYQRAGYERAYQVTVNAVPAPSGRMDLNFKASVDEAMISNIRLISGTDTAVEINVWMIRQWQALPLRFVNGDGQDVHEVILGRFGSRFMVNPVPQLLAWRQSPLGTWTEDLSELALAFRDADGDIRCLPFTDRYPVFSSIDQELALTGVSYLCEDPQLGFKARVTLRAPFYPQDAKLSTAPFFYLDVKVTNPASSGTGGDFMLVRPHKESGGTADPADMGTNGYKFTAKYNYSAESRVTATSTYYEEFWEAMAVDDASGVNIHKDLVDDAWIWDSPAGYPLPYRHQVYTFEPRGYSGFDWGFSLPAGASASRTFVLASHCSNGVLNVLGDNGYGFLYAEPSGPVDLASVDEVVGYALGPQETSIRQKSSFFDGLLSEPYLNTLNRAGRDLAAVALQSFIANAWWVHNGTSDWFSVWEGTPCMFHSTIDVEYNDAWFYLCFWPDLLAKLLQEWTLFEKSNAQGKYLSHDMGVVNTVNGMAYPHDMPVEENANYILLLYAYWKYTGDPADLADTLFDNVKRYTEFIFNCDIDANGLPDINVANTIDQGSPAIQNSRNQTYLGVKALAAYRAAREMAAEQAIPDQGFIADCDDRIRLINMTLENELWQGDHYSVCADYSVPSADRDAYSIYTANGLLYLLSGSMDDGLTASNQAGFETDLVAAAEETSRRYGFVHTDVNNENQWVSQNLWRDAIGSWMGVGGWTSGQDERLNAYWNLEDYYARKKNGGFWDVCVYHDFYFLGTSEAAGLGFADSYAAALYLSQARLEAGGMRGAYALDSAFLQSLGYYPRGTALLSLLAAPARLHLDLDSDLLIYHPSGGPYKAPVFVCADWAAKRVPVLSFDAAGELSGTTNGDLLPSKLKKGKYDPIADLEAHPFSCSPGTGDREELTVSYTAPEGSITGAEVLSGETSIRELPPGPSGVTWDGRDGTGQPVTDGLYTIYLETDSPNPAVYTPPDTAEVGVNTNIPTPSNSWYLAEGYTGSNPTGGEFDTWVLVQNPGDVQADIEVTFMQPGGVNTARDYTLSPHSRFTIHVDDILPDAEVSTRIESDAPVVAERAVYFNDGQAGHDTIGVTSPYTRWYLAEGYTGGDFDEWVLVQNPGRESAEITVSLQPQDQDEVVLTYRVEPRSRYTIHVDDILPDAQVSTYIESDRPVVVERAQYLNYMRSGTCSIAARSPSRTWYFAEGYTGGGFEEWLLVQNPQDSWAAVNLTFMKPGGGTSNLGFSVPPRSRYTVDMNQVIPDSEVSVKVLADAPVVAERAMYWEDRSDGHDTIGTPCPEYEWYFAEGYTGGGFEEWLLIQNPWGDKTSVDIEFMLPGGTTRSAEVTVPPRSRYTINVGAEVGPNEVSVKVSSDLPVVAERAMYFNQRSGGTCSIGAIR